VNFGSSVFARLVTLCVERAWIVVALAVILGAAITNYVAAHFAMATDTYALLSPKLAWRVRETAFNVAFPQDAANVVVVIDAQTPELGEEAAAKLAAHLSAQRDAAPAVTKDPDDTNMRDSSNPTRKYRWRNKGASHHDVVAPCPSRSVLSASTNVLVQAAPQAASRRRCSMEPRSSTRTPDTRWAAYGCAHIRYTDRRRPQQHTQ
jgi:hypothetical protein